MRAVLTVLLLAGCAVPPPDAYVAGGQAGRPEQAVSLGQNTVGEACVQYVAAGASAEVYCGAWQQPSARVRAAGAASLESLATSGPWRARLDASYLCNAPRPTTLEGGPALLLDCTRKVGGWPHVAVVASSGGQAWLADGVVAALPAMERSVAVLSGRATPTRVSSASLDELQAQRGSARARATGDVREFDQLMAQGTRANLQDNPVAAGAAFSVALAIQEKAQGADSPNLADPAMHLALQLSNQGRFAEADALFARARALAPRQRGDDTLVPRLLHYEGMHAYNQQRNEDALALLRQAEAGYLSSLPPDALRPRPAARGRAEAALTEVLEGSLGGQTRIKLAGVVETRRYQGEVLREMGRRADSDAAIRAASDAARSAGLAGPEIAARLRRTGGINASLAGNPDAALSELQGSGEAFARAYPASRPLARVELLRAAELMRARQPAEAAAACRSAMAILQELKSAFTPENMMPCLDAFAAQAEGASGPARQAALRDMFGAAQLVRGTTTSQQIQQASARLAEGRGNPRVGEAIREQQDASGRLADLRRQREALAQAARDGAPVDGRMTALAEQEAATLAALAELETTLQAAAPNYGQLVQQAVTAEDVQRALRPGEAFAAITLTADSGWTFLLRDGVVQAGRVRGGARTVDPLVQRIRAGMAPSKPTFDTGAAAALFDAVFGEVRGGLDGVAALTVAPSGSLLSLPFGVLLTGPGDPAALGKAPWLLRQLAIGHVPSAGNYVALRKVAGGSTAQRPWFGFGEFKPVSAPQARATFPASCGSSADLLAGLPPLPSARTELGEARKLLGGNPADTLLGDGFTAEAVQQANLSDVRVLHFAAHALLPAELNCLSEPALVTSAPRQARTAAGALLKASDLAQIKLDADLVILSACNSGGVDGKNGGESLSTLARSFFYGGARALLVTHWDVTDGVAPYLVVGTLKRVRDEPSAGLAAALRTTQLELIAEGSDGAGQPGLSHPYFWAPFALIGPAGAAPATQARL